MISIALVTLIATVQSQSCTIASECMVDQYCDTSGGSEGTCQFALCSNGDCSAYQDFPFCDSVYCNPNCTITEDYCLSVYGVETPCITETGLCEPATCLNVVDYCPEWQICNTQNGSCFDGFCSTGDCSAYPSHPICDSGYCFPDCNTASEEFCNNTWGSDWAYCGPATGICEQGATCVNTPTLCDSLSAQHFRDVPLVCNTTSETCYFDQCTTNLQCANWVSLNGNFASPFPGIYCDVTSGTCALGCLEPEDGCDGFYNFYLSEYGGLLPEQLFCNSDIDGCEQKTCFDSTDCDANAGFGCVAGHCTRVCSDALECYHHINYLHMNGSGMECASPYADAPKICLPQQPCSINDNCMNEDGDVSNRICSAGYCETISCDTNDECETALNNDVASCNVFSDPKICLNNECQTDLDCPEPFDSCLLSMAEAGYSNGYTCYKKCDYDNTTTTDNEACSVFGTDGDGYDIQCNIGVPGDEEIEYCDIYNVNYTSCIIDGCENGYECNLDTHTCDLPTTVLPTASPTDIPQAPTGNICNPDESSNKCHGKASLCKKDSQKSGSTYSQIDEGKEDEWCAWCLCMEVQDYNPLEECAYYWLNEENLQNLWKEKFAALGVALQEYFVVTCFPPDEYPNCKWNNVKLKDQVTGCDCNQFTCDGTTAGVGRYNVFGIIVVVLVMVSCM